jgi:ubiquinone/menaquinone biosynthesis C-methylase UbiE
MRSTFDLEKRVQREYQAHTDRDVSAENIRIKERFSHIENYPSRRRLMAIINKYASEITDNIILDYGCGPGSNSLKYLQYGARKVYGIDISPVYISNAIELMHQTGIDKDLFDFRVMDAHSLEFKENTFNLVFGNGILHHLNPDIALKEIHRVLKPNGRVLFFEPLADNPLLKLFRKLTPSARTEDETPFTGKKIRDLLDQYKWKAELFYCGLFEAPVAMVTSILMPKKSDNLLLRIADIMERWTHEKQILLSWNQYILFHMIKIP